MFILLVYLIHPLRFVIISVTLELFKSITGDLVLLVWREEAFGLSFTH